jgi:hypothetical protein
MCVGGMNLPMIIGALSVAGRMAGLFVCSLATSRNIPMKLAKINAKDHTGFADQGKILPGRLYKIRLTGSTAL